MIFVSIPDNCVRKLSFYLAMEEYLLNEYDDDFLFVWRVQPSVIIGHNQTLSDEVNLEYCKQNDISIYRRKSGGGCVYSDMGNLMISQIYRDMDVEKVFARHLHTLQDCLSVLGVQSLSSHNNDILIEGRKVSGNALQLTVKGCVVHGTMLFDCDFNHMIKAITPSVEKLMKNGIKSARQRVVNLSEVANIEMCDFVDSLVDVSKCTKLVLSAEQIKCIEMIETDYLSNNFIYSK